MSTRHTHLSPALPAATAAVSFHSKNHVLAGVQDAYWSDDDAEEKECPLCMEEMDLSDMGFKPCPCGYQICRFCWHHIKENLNGRCPACRREYTDEGMKFTPVGQEDQKRVNHQKRLREKEKKDLDALNRRALTNTRVVQRNIVYVSGLAPRFAKEEMIPTLRSNEYFGQYGKISKMFIRKRTEAGTREPIVGLYITYHRREDAARAISAVDGTPSPGGGGEIIRASHGTTKYCMSFLRNLNCSNQGCLDLHEWGEERDCFTKKDLATLKHTEKDTEHRPNKELDSSALPRTAAWAHKPSLAQTNGPPPGFTSTSKSRHGAAGSSSNGTSRPRPQARGKDSISSFSAAIDSSSRTRGPKTNHSRPTTPSTANLPARPSRTVVSPPPLPSTVTSTSHTTTSPPRPASVATSAAVESDVGSYDIPSSSASVASPVVKTAQPVSKLPAAPPGLPPPPAHILQVGVQPSGGYQPSTQAQALVEEVRARRESHLPKSAAKSPFPDLDRTLENLGDGKGFSFNFSVDLPSGGKPESTTAILPRSSFSGNFDPFATQLPSNSAVHQFSGHGSSSQSQGYQSQHTQYDYEPARRYQGSFNPFDNDRPGSQANGIEDPLRQQTSRFGFARKQPTPSISSSSGYVSPINNGPPLRPPASSGPLYASPDVVSPRHPQQWNFPSPPLPLNQQQQQQLHEYGRAMGMSGSVSTMAPHARAGPQSPPLYRNPTSTQFQPFDHPGLNEHLNGYGIGNGRSRTGSTDQAYSSYHQFSDPTMMSMRHGGNTGLHMQQNQHHSHLTGGYSQQQPSSGFGGQSQLPFGPPPGIGPSDKSAGASGKTVSGLDPSNQFNPFGLSTQHQLASQQNGASDLSSPSAHADTSSVSATSGSNHPPGSSHPPSSNHPHGSMLPAPSLPAPPPLSIPTTLPPLLPPSLPASQPPSELASPHLSASEFPALPSPIPTHSTSRHIVPTPAITAAINSSDIKQAATSTRKAPASRRSTSTASISVIPHPPVVTLSANKPPSSVPKKANTETIPLPAAEKKYEKEVEKEKGKGKEKERGKDKETRKPSERIASPIPPVHSKPTTTSKPINLSKTSTANSPPASDAPRTTSQAPMLSKKAKKKQAKANKLPKAEASASHLAVADDSEPVTPEQTPIPKNFSILEEKPVTSLPSLDCMTAIEPTSLGDLLNEVGRVVDLDSLGFFDYGILSHPSQSPLKYAPLVHALSALAVGGPNFTQNMPTGTIDSAVSSFQQLLETLTQTISDLLRLLPHTTWDDGSSFDGVLRDMLRAEDALEETGDDAGSSNERDDEVAALALALSKRSMWMQAQLSKLEELHRDINITAVRAVLAYNDRECYSASRLPRGKSTLVDFDRLGQVQQGGEYRVMNLEELEKGLAVAKKEESEAETALKRAIGVNSRYLWDD